MSKENNPISKEVFCADPTAIEVDGRLYIYGTNDHQQCRETSEDKDNTYEKIKSLVVFSTDNMVDFTYHGEINVKKIAPWIISSWAPSITAKKQEDGKIHYYLYFSNNGTGVGVITSTSPLGPWEDPLGKPLLSTDTKGLTDCKNPFDPGVVVDDDGVGYLTFGGSDEAQKFDDRISKASKIVRLGADMVSIDSEIATIPAPYFFEASELNFINGTYVYTYCSDWNCHSEVWDYNCDIPGKCSMIYLTSKTPLITESWQMGGEVLKNPGDFGYEHSNNHTHMHKFKGKWYILYHTLFLKADKKIKGGYRSICVDEINVNEENVIIKDGIITRKGVSL